MKIFLIVALCLVGLGLLAGLALRFSDHRADRREMARLLAAQPTDPPRFSIEMVADLPEPARRFLAFAIADGTPLRTVAEIEMTGRFSLGTQEAPNYLSMIARQVLAAPQGFVWKMSAGRGVLAMSGSDSGRWTRFWLMGLIPVARLGGDDDHARSAFGRYVAEAAFWTPAALLPGAGAEWQEVDDNTARYTMARNGHSQSVDVTVAADGRPTQVQFQRWSNANPDGIHRLQPFGGYLSEFREFQGYTVPTHVEAGNLFGTDGYFPFFIADVASVRFPPPADVR